MLKKKPLPDVADLVKQQWLGSKSNSNHLPQFLFGKGMDFCNRKTRGHAKINFVTVKC